MLLFLSNHYFVSAFLFVLICVVVPELLLVISDLQERKRERERDRQRDGKKNGQKTIEKRTKIEKYLKQGPYKNVAL